MGMLTFEEARAAAEDTRAKREKAEAAAQNPRSLEVNDTAIERRNGNASALLAHYRFMTKMYLPGEALKQPPPEGWPSINAERFAFLGKTDVVIDLYKHIPYISQDKTRDFRLDSGSICLDYAGKEFESKMFVGQASPYPGQMDGQEEPIWDRLKEPQHVAILALPTSTRGGWYMALDVRDGKAAHLKPVNETNSVTAWESNNLQELLEGSRKDLVDLEDISVAPTEVVSRFNTYYRDYADRFQASYRKHGWPSDDFDKDACMHEVARLREAYWSKED